MKRTTFDHTPDGLRRRLADLERQVADLQRVRNPPQPYNEVQAAGGGAPYLLVAASNAHAWSQEAADYVCDGTADDVEIQAALDDVAGSWNGGLVLLSEGSFALAAPLQINVGPTTLRGSGNYATWLTGTSGMSECIANWSISCAVESLLVQGADLGIKCYFGSDFRVVDVRFGITGTGGIGLDLDTGDNTFVTFCRFANSGLRVDNRRALITGNYFDFTPVEFTPSAEDAMFFGNFVPNVADVSDSSTSTQYGTNFSLVGPW